MTNNLVSGKMGDWEIVIGMEVHAQILSHSKLFSGAATAYGAEPNSQVSFVDSGFPGMLPVLNEACLKQAILTGLGLNAKINTYSRFDRKNYFYPDLPQGYQISQFYHPIIGEGFIKIDMQKGEEIEIGIERLHLEQDAGKSIHDFSPDMSYIDLNRSGVALMEIVTKPELRSADQAVAFLKKLRALLRYLETCDGNMEEGSMRADVNISVRRVGEDLGTRCEIKNVNSMKFIAQAIEFESKRQIEILENDGKIEQETRLYDPKRNETRTMRSKEEAHDYRYFPDPDLPPVLINQDYIDQIKVGMLELPDQKKKRFITEYQLSSYDAEILSSEKEIADFYEVLASNRNAKKAANWLTGSLFGALNKEGISIIETPISAKDLGSLIDCIEDGTISGRIAKDVFEIMFKTGEPPNIIIEREGLKQVTDFTQIEQIIDEIIKQNPDKIAQIKAKPKALGWVVGQVMKASQGKANPSIVNQLLRKKLSLDET